MTKPTVEQLLQGCESEQLHLSGAIQSFGAMLRVDATELRITHASANLGDYLGLSAHEVLGEPVKRLGWLTAKVLSGLPQTPGKSLVVQRVAETATGRVDALLIRSESSILVELECNEAAAEPIALHEFQRLLLNSPFELAELAEHHAVLLRAFRTITGLDRVMIYRFREDWSGEVIAEDAASGMGTYLGLRFPASDIPAIARNLYMINPSRMIPDTSAPTVPVLSIDDTPPDLTRSDLRSVSPMHLEYLANMGVGASFSVPVRVGGRLWGLVACHHLAPRLLTPDQRSSCVVLTSSYSLALTSYFSSQRLRVIDSLERRIDHILESIAQCADPLDGIESSGKVLMEIMGAGCFAMAINDDVVVAGEGPDLEQMAVIDGWFLNESKDPLFAHDRIGALLPEAKIRENACGMLAIKALSARSGWVRFYWFRPAEPQEVLWAGNPNKPQAESASVPRLSPRRSFEKWVETTSGFSRPWSNEDRMVGAKFRSNLLRWL